MGEFVLYKVSHTFAVPPDFKRSDTGIPVAGTVFVRIVAIGADGIGFTTILFRIVEYPPGIVIYTRVASEDVDPHRKDEASESRRCCPVTVAVVGTGDKGNVFSDIEHVVVLVGEIAEIVA